MVISGNANGGTVEIVELPAHPFLLASLSQPQVGSGEGELQSLLGACAGAIFSHHQPEPGTR